MPLNILLGKRIVINIFLEIVINRIVRREKDSLKVDYLFRRDD